jgi:hypothetical protein
VLGDGGEDGAARDAEAGADDGAGVDVRGEGFAEEQLGAIGEAQSFFTEQAGQPAAVREIRVAGNE